VDFSIDFIYVLRKYANELGWMEGWNYIRTPNMVRKEKLAISSQLSRTCHYIRIKKKKLI